MLMITEFNKVNEYRLSYLFFFVEPKKDVPIKTESKPLPTPVKATSTTSPVSTAPTTTPTTVPASNSMQPVKVGDKIESKAEPKQLQSAPVKPRGSFGTTRFRTFFVLFKDLDQERIQRIPNG